MFDLKGRVALVTGGAQGIGLAIVKELLRQGVKGASIVDVNETTGHQVVEELQNEFGLGKVLFVKTDVTSRSQFESAFQKTISNFSNLDIVINNAGVGCDRDWEKEIAVNLTGTVNGTMLGFERYLPESKTGSEGAILNVSSIAAFCTLPALPVYSATKSGVMALTRSMGQAVHYNRKPIKVMAICPGFTDTELIKASKPAMVNDDYPQILKDYLENGGVVFQTTEEVAKVAVNIIKEGKNGSVWVAENKESPYEVELLPYRQTKKKL